MRWIAYLLHGAFLSEIFQLTRLVSMALQVAVTLWKITQEATLVNMNKQWNFICIRSSAHSDAIETCVIIC